MVVLGSSFAISRGILDYPLMLGQAIRYALAAAVLAVALWLLRRRAARTLGAGAGGTSPMAGARRMVRPGRADLLRLGLVAATGLVGFSVCVLETLRHADPAVIGTAVGAVPIALAVFGPLSRGQRPTVRLGIAAAIVTGGTALVHGFGNATPVGLAWAVGAFGCEALFTLLAASMLPRLTPVQISTYACTFAVPMLLVAAVVTGERWQLPTASEAVTLGFLAVILTSAMFPLWYSGVQRLRVERAGMFNGLLPVVALVATVLADRQPPPLVQLAGVLVVGLGLSLGLSQRAASPAGTATVVSNPVPAARAPEAARRTLAPRGEAPPPGPAPVPVPGPPPPAAPDPTPPRP